VVSSPIGKTRICSHFRSMPILSAWPVVKLELFPNLLPYEYLGTIWLQLSVLDQMEQQLQQARLATEEQKKISKKQMTTDVLLNLRATYGSAEMMNGIQYLMELKSSNKERFEANKYAFAREYIAAISETSEEWIMRRRVSHFFQDAAVLIEAGCLSEDDFFSLYDPPMRDLIEFLEPIETAIAEKYRKIPYDSEFSLLLLLDRLNEWRRHRTQTVRRQFQLPQDDELYQRSLETGDPPETGESTHQRGQS